MAWLLNRRAMAREYGALLNANVSDATAAGRDLTPPRLRTLAASPLVSLRQSATVTFIAPDELVPTPSDCAVP